MRALGVAEGLDRMSAAIGAASAIQRESSPPFPAGAMMRGSQTQQVTPDPAKAHKREFDSRYQLLFGRGTDGRAEKGAAPIGAVLPEMPVKDER